MPMNQKKYLSANIRNIDELHRAMRDVLSAKYGLSEAEAMCRLIFHRLKDWDLTDIVINSHLSVSDDFVNRINEIINRVMRNEPIQYVLGEARFYGMNFFVNRAVLIPRFETEELVDLIVRENTRKDLDVLDIGTGSGAIAIALARNLKFANTRAIDISEKAIEVAIENARLLKADIKFEMADVFTFECNPQSYDIIVSNPPYIPLCEKKDMDLNVLDYEPRQALFVSDSEPLIFYSRISELSAKALKPGGRLYFEINPRFASEIVKLLELNNFKNIQQVKDISHKVRFICAFMS